MCGGGGGVVMEYSQTSYCGEPLNLIAIKSYLIGSDTHLKCDRRILCGEKAYG